MVQAIREHVTVEKEGTIEIRHPDLATGLRAEVIVLVERPVSGAGRAGAEASVAPIWEAAAEMGRTVPEEEWAAVPPDLSRNLDHYLYGAPREDE